MLAYPATLVVVPHGSNTFEDVVRTSKYSVDSQRRRSRSTPPHQRQQHRDDKPESNPESSSSCSSSNELASQFTPSVSSQLQSTQRRAADESQRRRQRWNLRGQGDPTKRSNGEVTEAGPRRQATSKKSCQLRVTTESPKDDADQGSKRRRRRCTRTPLPRGSLNQGTAFTLGGTSAQVGTNGTLGTAAESGKKGGRTLARGKSPAVGRKTRLVGRSSVPSLTTPHHLPGRVVLLRRGKWAVCCVAFFSLPGLGARDQERSRKG